MIDASNTSSEGAEQTVAGEQNVNVLLEETPTELFVYDLPESLEVIEEEAFFGCENMVIIAPKDSCAEKWAKDNGYSVSEEWWKQKEDL